MSPCSWGTRWKTIHHEEAKEIKGFFFLVLLTLIDTDYRFFGVDVESSGSSSDAQIFNCSKLRKETEDSTFGLPAPEPLGEEGQKTASFCWMKMPSP